MTIAIEMYRGESRTYSGTATYGGAALDLTGATLYCSIRTSVPASTIVADTDATIYKTSLAGGGISIVDADAGTYELDFVKADTNALAVGVYYIGLECVTAGSADYITLDTGTFSLLGDLVRGV
jgi:hypothetical protein